MKNSKKKLSEPALDDKNRIDQNYGEHAIESQKISENTNGNFPIVGIGASAGGLAAFEAFFSGLPFNIDMGMAFVLVQHLVPDHKSILAELIQCSTSMPVYVVADGVKVKRDCVYIIPPGRDIALLNGDLLLLEPSEPRGHRKPIDLFFQSLAQDQKNQAFGIVLSGTGSDGTFGIRAIKAEGGIVMAQSRDSAEYDGMPNSAIASGLVDFILPPAQMSAKIMSLVEHTFVKLPSYNEAYSKTDSIFKKICILIRAQTGHDFSQYKSRTIQRRIDRRMAVHLIDSSDKYLRYLQETPNEVEELFGDILRGVTKFFRDPQAFKVLEEEVIPKLFVNKTPDSKIRVWSPGCSTGEGAYSIAILLQEHMDTLKENYTVKVFGTDIDRRAIADARAGIYSVSIADHLSPERLSRFFTLEPDGANYRINKSIRNMLIFSVQDVIKDPPFSKIDLISCRNLMIYMSEELKKKLIPLFYYALKPKGFLFLGSLENAGDCIDLFETLDSKSKLYQRKEPAFGEPHIRRFGLIPVSTSMIALLPHVTPKAEIIKNLSSSDQKELLRSDTGQAEDDEKAADTGEIIRALKQELQAKDEYRQALEEELATSNEELSSINEELQSVNEELAAVNGELQVKVDDLIQSNDDINNLLAGTQIATVFLNHKLEILSFTPNATKIINLIQGDIGRPVGHIVPNFVGYNLLVQDAEAVLKTLIPKEIEVKISEEKFYTMRILPYRTQKNVIKGVVINFIDVTELVKSRESRSSVHKELLRLAVAVKDSHDAITVQDLDGHILAWNPGAVKMYGFNELEALTMNIRDFIPEDLISEEMEVINKLSHDKVLEPYRTRRIARDGTDVEIWMTATALRNKEEKLYAVATTERSIEGVDNDIREMIMEKSWRDWNNLILMSV